MLTVCEFRPRVGALQVHPHGDQQADEDGPVFDIHRGAFFSVAVAACAASTCCATSAISSGWAFATAPRLRRTSFNKVFISGHLARLSVRTRASAARNPGALF